MKRLKLQGEGGDYESFHGSEDALLVEVLHSIADGTCQDPKACAKIVLKSQDWDVERWYA